MQDLIKTAFTREIVEHISRQRSEPEWLLQKRLEAFSYFEQLEIPEFSYGLGITLDNNELDISSIVISEPIDPEMKNHDKRIIVKNIHEALKTHPEIIRKYLLRTKPKDKLHALVSAFWTEGIFIYVPKGVESTSPIEIENILSKQTGFQTILIILEPLSKASILISEKSSKIKKSYLFQNLEVFCLESSKLEFSSIQNFNDETINFIYRSAYLEKDASLDWNICDLGGNLTKSSVTTNLLGTGASVNNIGIFLGEKTQQFDLSVSANHLAPETSSEMLTKGALNGKSKTVYCGLIKIVQQAPRCSGYQRADIMLLSPEASASPIPNLEIETNDVKKCSHGATVGQVDKEKLFYLMSRGLSEAEAIKQIVLGQLEPAIEKIKIEKVRKSLKNIIEEKLSYA